MLRRPVVNAQLDQMNWLQRVAESFRYFLLSLEFWISPDGGVRQWVKFNTRFTVLLAAPTFLVFPVVTMALGEFETWVNALTSIASKLIFLPILVLLALMSISIVLRIIRIFKP